MRGLVKGHDLAIHRRTMASSDSRDRRVGQGIDDPVADIGVGSDPAPLI